MAVTDKPGSATMSGFWGQSVTDAGVWYPGNNTDPTTVWEDQTPYGNDGTLVNFPTVGPLVFDGNSIPAGTHNTSGYDYPSQVVALGLSRPMTKYNYASSGQTTQQMTADAVTQIDVLYAAGANANICVPLEIHNDLIMNALDAATALANYWTYCDARQAAGWKVVAVTVPPSTADPGGGEVDTINAGIRADYASHADALADIAADSRLADPSDTDYYSDGIHPTDAGAAVIAGIVHTAVEALLEDAGGWAGTGSEADPYRLVLDGVNDYVALPDLSAAEDKAFAYEAWCYATDSALTYKTVVGEGNSGTNTPFCYVGYDSAAGRFAFTMRDDAASSKSVLESAQVIDGALHHLIGSCDGSTMRLYVDSIEKGTATAPPVGSLTLNTMSVGALARASVALHYPAPIVVARIYSLGVTPAQVAQNYAAGPTGTDYVKTGLVLDLNAARAFQRA